MGCSWRWYDRKWCVRGSCWTASWRWHFSTLLMVSNFYRSISICVLNSTLNMKAPRVSVPWFLIGYNPKWNHMRLSKAWVRNVIGNFFIISKLYEHENPFRMLSGWLLPTEPFSGKMWTAGLIAFVGIFGAITTVKLVLIKSRRRFDIGSSFLQTFAIFMLQCTKIAWVN